jgi:MFS family permease
LFAAAGMNLAQVGLLAAIYPATWGMVQLATGAVSDRSGRKPLIVWGMWIQAAALRW